MSISESRSSQTFVMHLDSAVGGSSVLLMLLSGVKESVGAMTTKAMAAILNCKSYILKKYISYISVTF